MSNLIVIGIILICIIIKEYSGLSSILFNLIATTISLFYFPKIYSWWIGNKIKISIKEGIPSLSAYSNAIVFNVKYNGWLEFFAFKCEKSLNNIKDYVVVNVPVSFKNSYDIVIPFKNEYEFVQFITSLQKGKYNKKALLLFKTQEIFNIFVIKDVTKELLEFKIKKDIGLYHRVISIKANELWKKNGPVSDEKKNWEDAENEIKEMLNY